MVMARSDVINLLKSEIVDVEFKKLSGDVRVLTCTLNPAVLPPAQVEDPLSQKKVREINPEVCAVFDTINQGWRSFRWDSVISVNGEAYVD
jgi:WYL_2, Sm-like SH3 beta-barrel fold